jgi:hypothetical protein
VHNLTQTASVAPATTTWVDDKAAPMQSGNRLSRTACAMYSFTPERGTLEGEEAPGDQGNGCDMLMAVTNAKPDRYVGLESSLKPVSSCRDRRKATTAARNLSGATNLETHVHRLT